MPNYQQGRIYSIRSVSNPDLIYIGSTTQTLSRRFSSHKRKNSKCSSREIITIGDAYIELIENFPCNDIYELEARENIHMRAFNCVNKRTAIADCPHNKTQAECKDCGGVSICEHKRQKAHCKECGGNGFCEHNREKSQCKECNGKSICEHNREKSKCKACNGDKYHCVLCVISFCSNRVLNTHLNSKKHTNKL